MLLQPRGAVVGEQEATVGIDGDEVEQDSASDESRVARPIAIRIGRVSSAAVPRRAATAGGSKGTWYSYSKSARVPDQLRILVRPDMKKT